MGARCSRPKKNVREAKASDDDSARNSGSSESQSQEESPKISAPQTPEKSPSLAGLPPKAAVAVPPPPTSPTAEARALEAAAKANSDKQQAEARAQQAEAQLREQASKLQAMKDELERAKQAALKTPREDKSSDLKRQIDELSANAAAERERMDQHMNAIRADQERSRAEADALRDELERARALAEAKEAELRRMEAEKAEREREAEEYKKIPSIAEFKDGDCLTRACGGIFSSSCKTCNDSRVKDDVAKLSSAVVHNLKACCNSFIQKDMPEYIAMDGLKLETICKNCWPTSNHAWRNCRICRRIDLSDAPLIPHI